MFFFFLRNKKETNISRSDYYLVNLVRGFLFNEKI